MFDDFFMKSFYNLNLIITKRGRGKRAKKKRESRLTRREEKKRAELKTLKGNAEEWEAG
jgi:hypothetical protein